MHKFREKYFQGTGIIPGNKMEKGTIKSSKDLVKMSRGLSDYQFDKQYEITIVRWIDNKNVAVGNQL